MSIPALAQYAASEAPRFPVVVQEMPSTLLSFARLTNTVEPLSMNEPVGFLLSSLIQRLLKPSSSPSLLAWRSGVAPSPRVTVCSSATFGRNALNLQRPGGCASMSDLFIPSRISELGASNSAEPHLAHLASSLSVSTLREQFTHSKDIIMVLIAQR